MDKQQYHVREVSKDSIYKIRVYATIHNLSIGEVIDYMANKLPGVK